MAVAVFTDGSKLPPTVTMPADGEANSAVWFVRRGAEYHSLAQYHGGAFHLRFGVPASLKKLPCPSLQEEADNDSADSDETFLGRGLGRAKGCWTVQELRAYASTHGIHLPASKRSKKEIVRLMHGE
jgi:hypothetical protein